jgi:2-keto-4-pentenoate hydratase
MNAAEAIARAFVDARRAARGLTDYPGDVPETLDDAYRIQAHAIAADARPVLGWKVGRVPEALVSRFGDERLAGPIFDVIEAADDYVPDMPVFAAGFAAAEAEYLLRIGTAPDPARRDWTNDDALRHIDRVCVGIEIASSPFVGINDHGPAVTVSDFGNNNGLVIGQELPRSDWLASADWPVRLLIDGAQAGQATAARMLDGPFGAARFLFGLAARQGLALQAGQWISSGAVTGVHRVRPGQKIEALFGDGYSLRCAIGTA